MSYLRQGRNSKNNLLTNQAPEQRTRPQHIQGWRADNVQKSRIKNRLFGTNHAGQGRTIEESPINPNSPFSCLKEMGVVTNQHPDTLRISRLILAIQGGAFDYYIKGGFSRAKGTILTPVQVAQYHDLDISRCLFEIKDASVEQAIADAGIEVVTAGSFRIQRKTRRFAAYNNSQSSF